MSQVRTIFKNMSWLVISQIVASICGFIWTILIARYLGVHNYGILGFAISLTGIMSIFMDLGISTHIIRHIATHYDSAPKYLGNAIPLKILFSIGAIILTTIVLIIMKTDETTITITLLLTIEMIMKSYISLFGGTFQAFDESKYPSIAGILLNSSLLLFILISIYSDLGLFAIVISYIISNLIGLIYIYYRLTKNIAKPKFELDSSFYKKITIASLPFAATSILYSIYFSIDVVMLTNMVGNYATGIYNATYKLITILTIFYSVYTTVIFPVMSKFFKKDEKLLLISYEKSIKYLMLITIPLATAMTIYSLDIIQFIYGHEYDPASSVLSILIWTVCLLFIIGAGNTLLNASHKELTVTKIYTIAAIFNVVLNLFMIPYLSYDGAAITTVLSDALIVIIQSYVIYKLGHRINKKLYIDLGKIILGSVILGIALHFLNLNMWIALPVGIIIYFVTVTLFKLFDDDDKYIIKEIIGKNQ